MGKRMREEVEKLHNLRKEIVKMGGEEPVKRQHDRGKLTARERLDLLFEAGTFVETGMLGNEEGTEELVPADGVITGYGKINDGIVLRDAGVAAYDFTVRGGSMGVINEGKVTRIRQTALKHRIPMIWLVDSGGARLGKGGFGVDRIPYFADTGYLFKEEALMSGVVPLVAAMMGPGYAGTAYIPGLSDFVPMVKGKSAMGLGGPSLVKMVIGEDLTDDQLGGSRIHCDISGCGDLEVTSDEECIKAIKQYLSFFPQNCDQKPLRANFSGDPTALIDDSILDIIPDNAFQIFDMHELIKCIADDGRFFELKPKWARNIIIAFGRIGGYPVGIVANNPMHIGGIIDVDASDKAARFIWLCDAFNIPLLFLSDVPGYMVGSRAERSGIIRHGAKMIHAVAEATVPKLTLIVRKSYGAGYYGMCGRAFDPDVLIAYPGAEIAVMGAEGMVSIVARKQLATAEKPQELLEQLASQLRPHITIDKTAALGLVDDVIDPRETRRVLFHGLERTRDKKIFRHPRKHGVYPV
ncbi:MAG: propionyl-CoA carboxylase [Chloroflexi bacterium RBG_13_52_14]|nr:MAG: propionyl-CoA carboxylase [Chloroflexi bacterium RBG_13_52_14]